MAASDDPLRKLDQNESLRLGNIVGAMDQVMTQPILYWKNSFQQGLPFTMNPRLLYRGTLASVGSMSLTTGVQSTASGMSQKLLTGGSDSRMTYSQEVLAGFLGGMASGPVNGFMELIMIQQQRFGGSFLGTPVRLAQTYGVRSLTRGWLLTSGREGCYCAGYLGTVPATQKLLSEQYGVDPVYGKLLGAMGGGLLCAFLSQPLDTAKTCMQGDVGREKFGSFTQTLQTLKKDYGSVSAFYRGYWWRAGYIVVEFLLLDALLKGLAPV
eukprot:CAMPEP_0178443608 /NCGR_PEP_ID=MMETSP0689_2-20121128/39000_1 /TAXON_ID=160604 /ORGANISM="Amphidinium massartii, Strain CS-259" /LENGTH=267 /DNA_ID=CAMNT_0020067655 /DNA_START=188 /DNA_END=987 /DNA_ORIENTATION=+